MAILTKTRLLELRGWRCEFCGTKISNDYQAHHCLFHRMKGHKELDEEYNLMITCQACHPFANAYEVRQVFWDKQVIRYGIVAMLNWYNRVTLADKPDFWKGSEGCYSRKGENGSFEIVWDSGEVALMGGIMKRPLKPNDLIKAIYKISMQAKDESVPPGLQGAIIGILEEVLGSKSRRKSLLFRLFPGKWSAVKTVTTKDLLPGQWVALKRWIEPNSMKTPDGKTVWYGSGDFMIEADGIMSYSKYKAGQEHLDPDLNTYFLEQCREKYGRVPTMLCGHEADSFTALGNPFCSLCATDFEGKINWDAYEKAGDIPIKETM